MLRMFLLANFLGVKTQDLLGRKAAEPESQLIKMQLLFTRSKNKQ